MIVEQRKRNLGRAMGDRRGHKVEAWEAKAVRTIKAFVVVAGVATTAVMAGIGYVITLHPAIMEMLKLFRAP